VGEVKTPGHEEASSERYKHATRLPSDEATGDENPTIMSKR